MKRVFSLIFVLFLVTLLLGCGPDTSRSETRITEEDRKEVSIKANDKDICYTLTAGPFTTKDDFRKAYLEIDREKLIYAPKGSKVELDLHGEIEGVNVKAYWINKEGIPNYNDSFGAPLSMDIKVEEVGDSKYEYTVERLLQAGLSSYYEENEKIIAGYVAEIHSADETQYCFFMIQTDKN